MWTLQAASSAVSVWSLLAKHRPGPGWWAGCLDMPCTALLPLVVQTAVDAALCAAPTAHAASHRHVDHACTLCRNHRLYTHGSTVCRQRDYSLGYKLSHAMREAVRHHRDRFKRRAAQECQLCGASGVCQAWNLQAFLMAHAPTGAIEALPQLLSHRSPLPTARLQATSI